MMKSLKTLQTLRKITMTEQDKQLLLKDLCGRLPYGVIVNYNGLVRPLFSVSPTQHFQITLDNALDDEHNGLVYVSLDFDNADELKPYLRPMSSMTEGEKEEMYKIYNKWFLKGGSFDMYVEVIDWLNKHNFDYRGLIEKGLALLAPDGMYNN